jgi:hypothetical protein
MPHVLRQSLPLRKVLLVASETVILSIVIFAGLSASLWGNDPIAMDLIWHDGLSPLDARWRCLLSSITVALLTQVAISFNELYDFRVSASSSRQTSGDLSESSSSRASLSPKP